MVTQQLTNPRVTKLVEKFPPHFRERERELELRDKPKIKFQGLIPQPVHLPHSLILVEKVSPLHTPFECTLGKYLVQQQQEVEQHLQRLDPSAGFAAGRKSRGQMGNFFR